MPSGKGDRSSWIERALVSQALNKAVSLPQTAASLNGLPSSMGQSDPDTILTTVAFTLGYVGVSLLILARHDTSESQPLETRSKWEYHIISQ